MSEWTPILPPFDDDEPAPERDRYAEYGPAGAPNARPVVSDTPMPATASAPTRAGRGGSSCTLFDELPPSRAADAPTIPIRKGHLVDAAARVVAVLSQPGVGVYARGSELVRAVAHVETDDTIVVGKDGVNFKRADGAVYIKPFTDASLRARVQRHTAFTKYDARAEKDIPCDCPAEVIRAVMDCEEDWTVPRLRAVINAPTLRGDGSVITEPGYDGRTGLLLVTDRLWRGIPEKPTQRDAAEAIDVLMKPIAEFPFVADSDRAAAVALLITAVMRPALRSTPMFAISAPAAGTGKSKIVDVASVMATGHKAAVISATVDEAELEKRIGASLIEGDQVVSIDNVTRILRSDLLCQVLTQDAVKVRVLGLSKHMTVPSAALIACTGNGLSIFGDLNRRTIRIRIDAKCERPEDRAFAFEPEVMAQEMRTELVAAALTVVRAYLSAGAPCCASPMGSFEDWSGTVRSALIWANLGDCRGDVEAVTSDDPEKAELRDVLDALAGLGKFTAADVAIRMSGGDQRLRDALAGFIGHNGVLNKRSLGRHLQRFKGTRVGGLWVEQVKARGEYGAIWQVCVEKDGLF